MNVSIFVFSKSTLSIAPMSSKKAPQHVVMDDDCLPAKEEVSSEEKVWLDTWDLEPGFKHYVRENYNTKPPDKKTHKTTSKSS